jgi:hypothetical protein
LEEKRPEWDRAFYVMAVMTTTKRKRGMFCKLIKKPTKPPNVNGFYNRCASPRIARAED